MLQVLWDLNGTNQAQVSGEVQIDHPRNQASKVLIRPWFHLSIHSHCGVYVCFYLFVYYLYRRFLTLCANENWKHSCSLLIPVSPESHVTNQFVSPIQSWTYDADANRAKGNHPCISFSFPILRIFPMHMPYIDT